MYFAAIPHGGTAGERQRLRPVRRRDVLHRLLYTINHPDPRGDRLDHTIEFDLGRDDGRAVLYVDGREQAMTDMPGSFPVSGGVIEVAVGLHGVKVCIWSATRATKGVSTLSVGPLKTYVAGWLAAGPG